MPQLRKRLTNGASQTGRDQKPEKQSNAASETTVNLDNRIQKAKTTHNRNEKKANNGIRDAISCSASEVFIASCARPNRYKCIDIYLAPHESRLCGPGVTVALKRICSILHGILL